MTTDQEYFIQLSRAAIFDEEPPLPLENVDWQYIWDKSREQNLTGLLASKVIKLPKDKLPENIDQWNLSMMQTAMIMGDRFDEFERMIEILKENEIEPICLKGIVLKELYGNFALLRTMGDFDVWVEKEKIPKIKEIFISEGYSATDESMGINVSKGAHFWEIFFTLEEEFRANCQEWDKRFPENTVRTEDGILTLNPTYMMAHMMLHLGKHMVREGSGIRSLLDIALFLRKYREEIDYDFVRKACAEQHFENAYVYILNAANQYFDTDIEVEAVDASRFTEYMLTGGVFGAMNGNVMIHQAAKHEDKVGFIRRMFFPTVKMLDYRYTYLKKYPFLLPVAWVHRAFYARSHYGYSFGQMLKGIKGGAEFAKDRDKWLEELDLYDKEN